jgi:hypothetical protein
MPITENEILGEWAKVKAIAETHYPGLVKLIDCREKFGPGTQPAIVTIKYGDTSFDTDDAELIDNIRVGVRRSVTEQLKSLLASARTARTA